MNIISSKLKKIASAATVAMVLGATAFTALPAQAQSLEFGFRGDNGSFSFGIGNDRDFRSGRCMSERQLVRSLRDQGYRVAEVDYVRRNRAEVIASRRGNWWELLVNACNGTILDRDRIRRR